MLKPTKIPRLKLTAFDTVGDLLARPEGICADGEGTVWAADRNTFIARIGSDGSTVRYGSGGSTPNGVAVDRNGIIWIAEYQHGGLVRFDPQTAILKTVVTEVAGRKTSRANYPALDPEGRVWCTCSTHWADDLAALRQQVDDGFVFVLEQDGSTRVVAEGLHFANGLAFSKDFKWLYIVESSTRRIVRAPVRDGGTLGRVENFGPVLEATPDGIGFDEDENLWITLLIEKSALVVLDRSADLHTVIEDPQDSVLGRPTNVSFGGADMCDLYVGSLDRNCVLHTRVGVPGVRLPGQIAG